VEFYELPKNQTLKENIEHIRCARNRRVVNTAVYNRKKMKLLDLCAKRVKIT